MSNRLLALLILVLIFGGLYGAYYYFFVANVGAVSVVVTGVGSGTVSVQMTSELKQSYEQECGRICSWDKMPPVSYKLHATREGFIDVDKAFSIRRGETTKLIVRMDKEVILEPLEAPESAPPSTPSETGAITSTPDQSIVTIESGPIETIGGEPIRLSGTIYAVKETETSDIRLITTDRGVFTYSVENKSPKENPLYDDLLPLPSGDLIALVRKSSKKKLSLLNLDSTGDDYVLRINIERRDRSVLLRTREDGKYLDRQGGKIILVAKDGQKYEIKNAE